MAKSYRYYTNTGLYSGYDLLRNFDKTRVMNWIRSGNRIKIGELSYYSLGKSNTAHNNTMLEIKTRIKMEMV